MNANVWKLSLPATPMDMDAENVDFGLCELVRDQYLKRLRQTVSQNLCALIEDCNVDSRINSYIDVCVAEIEKEALRRCMVANLYREGMSRMVNAVFYFRSSSIMYVHICNRLSYSFGSRSVIERCKKKNRNKNVCFIARRNSSAAITRTSYNNDQNYVLFADQWRYFMHAKRIDAQCYQDGHYSCQQWVARRSNHPRRGDPGPGTWTIRRERWRRDPGRTDRLW